MRLRRAAMHDADFLWRLANDPQVRSASFTSDEIAWEEHVEWLGRRLSDETTLLFIGLDDLGRQAGQVRFDIDGKDATISVSLVREARGGGNGVALIRAGIEAARDLHRDLRRVHAFIRAENTASQRAFVRAGFSKVRSIKLGGAPAEEYVWRAGHTSGDAA